jgi:hypothetical protein
VRIVFFWVNFVNVLRGGLGYLPFGWNHLQARPTPVAHQLLMRIQLPLRVSVVVSECYLRNVSASCECTSRECTLTATTQNAPQALCR